MKTYGAKTSFRSKRWIVPVKPPDTDLVDDGPDPLCLYDPLLSNEAPLDWFLFDFRWCHDVYSRPRWIPLEGSYKSSLGFRLVCPR